NRKINDRLEWAEKNVDADKVVRFLEVLGRPVGELYSKDEKLSQILDLGITYYNRLAFDVAKQEGYPVGKLDQPFSLLDNKDVLKLEDIYRLLEESGVGIPAYYNKIEFEIDGEKATYNRSRSGCYFCFFQQKIEWVWLYEQHPDLFAQAMEYERGDFSWNQDEPLEKL
ncbi:hypothetical protein M8994_23230, partial [Brucella sp. 21LCYQ03]|nr:hypothetical protein [Brucella sp. 21LCYQ03]